MSGRTATVEIARSEGRMVFCLSSCTNEVAGMMDYEPLNLDPTTLPEMDSREQMCEYGDALARALRKHVIVDQELRVFFDGVDLQDANLQFAMKTAEAERYRWETLYTAPQFLALKGQCSMRRIILRGMNEPQKPCRYSEPIRVMALFSPALVESEAEFRALADAVTNARTRGSAIELIAYVGEKALLDNIRGDIAGGRLGGVEVMPIPASTELLEQVLREQAPQILHCFCHGNAGDGKGVLEFATISDHEAGESIGSVALNIERLISIQQLSGVTWLTVLNSCSGARSVARLNSMAAALARNGSPVTIGMAEHIRSDDATVFTKTFYLRAFQIIAAATEGPAAPPLGHAIPIDLGPAMSDARNAMHREALAGDAKQYRRWSLPVMYQRSEGLAVVCLARDLTAADKIRIDTVTKLLVAMSANTPIDLREQVLRLLDNEPPIDRKYWPDIWGNRQ